MASGLGADFSEESKKKRMKRAETGSLPRYFPLLFSRNPKRYTLKP